MSRRTADEEISAGRVTVNGRKAVLGEKIDPESDVILYKGKPTGGEDTEFVRSLGFSEKDGKLYMDLSAFFADPCKNKK